MEIHSCCIKYIMVTFSYKTRAWH